jgi:hypothetical protein
MKHFRYSFLVTALCLVAAYVWGSQTAEGGLAALIITAILGLMEVSLSFDNAVVNASVLREMDQKWRQLFLTVGILIAVFGMRLFFPLAIVAVATGMGLVSVADMAISTPEAYARALQSNHPAIASMGGMFLLLVFLHFMFDEERKLHWLGVIEERLAQLGKFDAVAVFVALLVLFCFQYFIPMDSSTRLIVLSSGLVGVMLHIAVSSLDSIFAFEASHGVSQTVTRSGVAGFLYLEVLDASFSFDGVIGAFAITRDVVVIMLGLAVGAMFVRSLTVYLVDQGTLDEFVYLEHGAHYAIGILALLMLASIVYHVGEVVTGLTGVALIVLSFYSSVRHKRKIAGLAYMVASSKGHQ